MIISKIETFPLRIPIKPDTQIAASPWADKNGRVVDSLLVKVTTDEGLVGWGEAFGFRAVRSAKLAIEELIAPLSIGKDASQIASLMLEVQKQLHTLGSSGPLFYGISAVDIALWDIAGKAADVPVVKLLGGGAPDLRCYGSLTRYSDPLLVRANVRRAVDAGFRCLKLHETEIPAIRAAREGAGSDIELALDVNCAWTLNDARARAEELKEFHLKWLEEPIWPPEDYDGLAQLRRACGIPIAAGENVSTLMEFERLLGAGAVDFVQPSVGKMGGISELCKIFPLAAVHNVSLMPQASYEGPGLLASIHVTAALGKPDAMMECRLFDLEADLYGGALSAEQGRMRVPQGPGLGVDPDPDVIRAYLST
jgi:L-alanine-DL-glutamate epimerase-like enolase superfamily enzyme